MKAIKHLIAYFHKWAIEQHLNDQYKVLKMCQEDAAELRQSIQLTELEYFNAKRRLELV